MKRAILCLAFALSGTAQARSPNAQLCAEMENLRAVAARTHRPQEVFVVKTEPMTFGCGRTADNPAQNAFCRAALDATDLEFTHGFPWVVYDCLRSLGLDPALETTAQYTGIVDRRRITHLTAQWADGGQIEIRYVPSGDFGDEPEFLGYWGRYHLVISPPNEMPASRP
jgi:hypothetical protein